MSRGDGGAAFPCQPRDPQGGFVDEMQPGMTLRDYFAAKAMAAMSLKWDGAYSPNDRLRDQPKADARWVATAAYRYADAMLAAREPTP